MNDRASSGRFAFALLALCFLLSGLAALVYQTAWTREFAFVFGTSELAVATVLAAYMAGLAAGAALGGRLVGRIRRPVLAYGVLELGVGLAALAVPLGIAAANALLLRFFGGGPGLPDDTQLAVSIYYLVASFGILMLPTLFMGATLPLLVRHAVEDDAHLGPRIGALYAINTGGAVIGTLLTAFVLLPNLGLRSTVWVAASVNGLVFVLAALLARAAPVDPAQGDATLAPEELGAPSGSWILPLMTISGIVSFTYEVLWTRILSHLLGGSVYAFATMLASFLLGIALGSAVASRLARTRAMAVAGFAGAQIGAGVLSLMAFVLIDRVPGLLPGAMSGMAGLERGALVAIAVLLPAALCIGATYPLAVRILARGASEAGRASARAYSWNTVGSIFGAVLAAFWVLPTFGFEGTVRVAAVVNLLLAVAVLGLGGALLGTGSMLRIAAPAGIAVAALFWPLSPPWRVLAQGPEVLDASRIQHYAVGRSATVLLIDSGMASWQLRTNGLPESTIHSPDTAAGSQTTARWLSILPAQLRPEARSLVVIGLGGGVSVEAVPSTFEKIHVIELEPEVVEANRIVGPWRWRDPLVDPRVEVLVNDARSSLLLTGDRFGAITAQASHPWTAGSSHLYSQQFFELIESRLEEDGVFVQWMGLGFVDESLLQSIVATLRAVWTHVRVYQQPPSGGLLFAASNTPFAGPFDDRLLRADPETMAMVGVAAPEDLAVHLLLDERGAASFSDGAAIITDDRNLLQMRSPRVVGTRNTLAHRWPSSIQELDPLVGAAGAVRPAAIVAQLIDRKVTPRAVRVTLGIEDPDERELATALVQLAQGKTGIGRRGLLAFLAKHPEDRLARGTLLLREQTKVARGDWPGALPEDVASDWERSVARAWRAERDKDWEALEALDEALGSGRPDDPLARSAVLLRARWRNESGRELERVGELVDQMLPRQAGTSGLLMARARAAQELGDPELLIATAAQLVDRQLAVSERAALTRWLKALPDDGPASKRRRSLLDQLAARAARRS